VFAFDKVYKRVGKSNQRVSSGEIRKLALEGKRSIGTKRYVKMRVWRI